MTRWTAGRLRAAFTDDLPGCRETSGRGGDEDDAIAGVDDVAATGNHDPVALQHRTDLDSSRQVELHERTTDRPSSFRRRELDELCLAPGQPGETADFGAARVAEDDVGRHLAWRDDNVDAELLVQRLVLGARHDDAGAPHAGPTRHQGTHEVDLFIVGGGEEEVRRPDVVLVE